MSETRERSRLVSREDTEPPFEVQPDQQVNIPVATTGDTVTVACKLPHGIVMRLQKWAEIPEQMVGGTTRMVKISRYDEEKPTIVLNGCANPVGLAPKNITFGGYALTYGVPRDFFELWMQQNQDLPFVKQGLVFAHKRADNVQKKAKDEAERKSGLEPLDPTRRMKLGPFSVETMVRDS